MGITHDPGEPGVALSVVIKGMETVERVPLASEWEWYLLKHEGPSACCLGAL